MASESSVNHDAPEKAIIRIREQSDDVRIKFVIDTFIKCFGDDISRNKSAFKGRFRKMAANPFNFYRGSAVVFYHDLQEEQDPWARDTKAGNIFIHVSIDTQFHITFSYHF